METITFRPLRQVKKTGKISVASYLSWRKVKNFDVSVGGAIIIDTSYKGFSLSDLVHNHKGENLFWRDYNPNEIKQVWDIEDIHNSDMWVTDFNMYSAKGLDVDGVPTFSHFTSQKIASGYDDVSEFEPLTVEQVNFWLGWFLHNLENSKLIFQ